MSRETLPAVPLDDDVIDQVAREIAAQVADHIEGMYPNAAKAVAWKSCKRSMQGVIRNGMAGAGKAAEGGTLAGWIASNRRLRKKMRAMRKLNGWGY